MFQERLEEVNQKSISLTAFRTLLVMAELMRGPITKDELMGLLSEGGETASQDTLKRTLNTLKQAGFIISRPTEKNDFKYVLISHPFMPDFQNADFLNTLRENLVLTDDLKRISAVNKFYEKVCSFNRNERFKNLLEEENPFKTINQDILDKFISGEYWEKIVEINYFSANSGFETLKFIPERLSMKNSKVYVWGYGFKYNQFAFLNFERIKSIVSVYEMETDLHLPAYEINCILSGDSAKSFVPEKNEEILKRDGEEIRVKLVVSDEFSMFQRLLPFGRDLKYIEPEYFRVLFAEKLRKIRRRYSE